jgi:putative dimethyl sulfoxide reductase chaperone
MTGVESELARASRRLKSYRLLADCYYTPDEKLIEKLRGAGRWDGGTFSSLVRFVEGEEDLMTLAVDAAKLFVGPFELLAPPYGSVYLEDSRMVMGETTIDAEKLYISEGLKLELKEAPDHITVELEFLSYLNYLQVEALKANDWETATGYRAKQVDFLNEHVSRWVFRFGEKIERFSQTEFYKKVAYLTAEQIKEDLEDQDNAFKKRYV